MALTTAEWERCFRALQIEIRARMKSTEELMKMTNDELSEYECWVDDMNDRTNALKNSLSGGNKA